jgi:hypothetical protein
MIFESIHSASDIALLNVIIIITCHAQLVEEVKII